MGEQLQREGRSLDHPAVGPPVADLGRPLLPEGRGVVELARALVAVHRMDVVVVVAQHDPTLFPLLHAEAGGGGGLLDHPLKGLGTRQGEDLVGAVGGEESGPEQLEPGGPRAVLEPGHEDHAHQDPPAGAAQPAVDLGMRAGRTAVLGYRHEIGQGDDSVVGGAERGLEDVGAGQIPLGGGPPPLRVDRPGSTPLGVEQGREDASAVEARQAAPVDRAIETDQGGRAHVANEAVGGNRLLASGAGAPSGSFGRRLILDVGHRPSISRVRRILHRQPYRSSFQHPFTETSCARRCSS